MEQQGARAARAVASRTRIINGALILLVLGVSLVGAFVVARSMIRSLRRLQDTATRTSPRTGCPSWSSSSPSPTRRTSTPPSSRSVSHTRDEIGQVARGLRRGAPRGGPTRRRAGAAARQRQRDVHQPLAPQPGPDPAPAVADLRAGVPRGRPGPAVLAVQAGPPRDPYAPQRREPAGPRGRGAGPPLDPPGPAGRRAARRRLRGGAVRAHRTGLGARRPRSPAASSTTSSTCSPSCWRTPPRSPRPQTKVRVTGHALPDGRVLVEIHDTGIGLSPEDLADDQRAAGQPARPWTSRSPAAWACSWSVGCPCGTASASSCAPRDSGGTTALVMLPVDVTQGGPKAPRRRPVQGKRRRAAGSGPRRQRRRPRRPAGPGGQVGAGRLGSGPRRRRRRPQPRPALPARPRVRSRCPARPAARAPRAPRPAATAGRRARQRPAGRAGRPVRRRAGRSAGERPGAGTGRAGRRAGPAGRRPPRSSSSPADFRRGGRPAGAATSPAPRSAPAARRRPRPEQAQQQGQDAQFAGLPGYGGEPAGEAPSNDLFHTQQQPVADGSAAAGRCARQAPQQQAPFAGRGQGARVPAATRRPASSGRRRTPVRQFRRVRPARPPDRCTAGRSRPGVPGRPAVRRGAGSAARPQGGGYRTQVTSTQAFPGRSAASATAPRHRAQQPVQHDACQAPFRRRPLPPVRRQPQPWRCRRPVRRATGARRSSSRWSRTGSAQQAAAAALRPGGRSSGTGQGYPQTGQEYGQIPAQGAAGTAPVRAICGPRRCARSRVRTQPSGPQRPQAGGPPRSRNEGGDGRGGPPPTTSGGARPSRCASRPPAASPRPVCRGGCRGRTSSPAPRRADPADRSAGLARARRRPRAG